MKAIRLVADRRSSCASLLAADARRFRPHAASCGKTPVVSCLYEPSSLAFGHPGELYVPITRLEPAKTVRIDP
jgi:hypothetical protein